MQLHRVLPIALALAAVAPQASKAGTILSNTYNGISVAGNDTATVNPGTVHGWMAVGWTMGSDNYDFTSAQMLITNQGGVTGSTFSTSLWSDSSGTPGTELASLSSSAITTFITLTPNAPFTLEANTTYWIMIVNSKTQFRLYGADNAPSGTGATYVGVKQSDPSISSAPGTNPVEAITFPSPNPAYLVLSGTLESSGTPEPGTWALMAGTAVVLAARRVCKSVVTSPEPKQ